MPLALGVLFSAAVLGCAATAALRPVLARRRLVDAVNHRSSHTVETLRGGGLAVLVALVLVTGTMAAFGPDEVRGAPLLIIGVCAVAGVGLLGWWEDVRGLPVAARFSLQLVAAVVVAVAVALAWDAPVPALVVVAAVLTSVFYVNAANFMDGVNGISAQHAVVTGVYAALVGSTLNQPALVVLALSGAGAFLGFLPWNFPSARLFLGDVGSYTLGIFVWFTALWIAVSGAPLVVAIAPLVVYGSDVVLTLLIRASRGENLAQAHREHVYQLVQQKTGSHVTSSGTVTALTAVCCLIGWMTSNGTLGPPVAVVALAVVAALYCSLRLVVAPSRTQDEVTS
ncbi:UDP-phosphate glycosyltransferase [Sanguibacter inulinus]|uniref:UDP-phosphate glycosyltransferase n=1 Tax=Sanguibacter inulinus TaxID=60922 RepID=A0A853ETD4_9MICO|nr:UDP-phosphate glycosyltransferase [Sanguibacter inulinus]MBF0722791.1 UDP-phosphate glycosyltransferase [Sanguibacter inulinus]NYS93936.1 UDP-phosphate glycosyltransferase [Sanguibacter inulinus]